MARAMSSFPVPVSPSMSTVLFIGDTSSSVEKTARMAGLPPMMLSNRNRPVELRSQLGVLLPQLPRLDGSRHDVAETFELKRFLQKIDGAAFQRHDGLVDTAESGDHHSANQREQRQSLVEDLHPVLVRQAQIDDEGVVDEPVQPRDRVGPIHGLRDRQSLRLERIRDQLAEFWFVFHQEDRCSGGIH
jgi:hypothetical protein